MKRSLFGTLVAIAALSAPVAAQGASLFSFGIMGGWATPYGTTKDYAKSGWDAGVMLAIGAPLVPVSFRVDANYATMGGKPQQVLLATATPTFDIWSATGNIVWNVIGNTMPTKVYLIGGIGYYNVQQIVSGLPTTPSYKSAKFGYNAGIGVRFTKFFVEARWNDVQSGLDLTAYGKGTTNLEMIPINVGILF